MLTAVGQACEVGEFRRFRTAEQFLSFVGLVPSERCSGDGRRQGSITKAGSAHARRPVVEAARNSRRPPTVGYELARRHRVQDPPGGVRPADQTLASDRQALVTANAQQALAADENQESAGAKSASTALLGRDTGCPQALDGSP